MARAQKYFITAIKTERLRDLLRRHLPERVDVDKVICAGGVWCQRQRLLTAHQRIPAGTTVIVYVSQVQGKRYQFCSDAIVDETDDFVVVKKPPGLTTVSDRSNLSYNLMASLSAYYQSKGQRLVLSPITRLDYMVSGLTLVTKHVSATRDFSKKMQKRTIGKYYLARLSWFEQAPKCLRCIDFLGHAGKAFLDPNGKRSESLFILRQENRQLGWLEYGVKLYTGRRHQIRFQASLHLKPLLGDGLYGDPSIPRDEVIALCSYGLNFRYRGCRYRYRLESDSVFNL